MDWYYLVSFALMAAVIEISPGPNFLLIARSVSTVGRSVALANIPGFSVAFMLHGALSIYGVSAVIQSNPALLLLIQIAGAGYLLYLGLQSLGASTVSGIVTDGLQREQPLVDIVLAPVAGSWDERFVAVRSTNEFTRSGGAGLDIILEKDGDLTTDAQSIGRCFLDGFVTNILNPKITLFYWAAFPQVLNKGVEMSGSSFALVLIHVLINAVWFVAVAFVLDYLVCRSVSGRFVVGLRRVSGYALIALSLLFVASAVQLI